jgi:hypothetical protein
MVSMIVTLLTVVVMPAAGVVGLLLIVRRRERAGERRLGRQISVTDAIAAELGLIVAPVIRRRSGHGWRIEIAVPLEDGALVGRIVGLAHAAMRRVEPDGPPLDIVLTAQSIAPAQAKARAAGGERAHRRARGDEVIAWTGTTGSRAS